MNTSRITLHISDLNCLSVSVCLSVCLSLALSLSQICHSRTGEINPVKVSTLVKLYVQRYKYFRKHGRKMDNEDRNHQLNY